MTRALLTIALGLAVGLGIHLAYFQLRRPATTNTLEDRLAWMKSELQLTEAQFARVRDIHQASGPRLNAIAAQAAGLQAEFMVFEQLRRAEDRVDFLEFARYVELRRRLSSEGRDSTRQLVLAAAAVMTPQQRERYIRLVETDAPLAPLTSD
jgi:hypothetical protein